MSDFDIRSILDWEYYIERFASTVQKLITIPAAMQKVANPVPRIAHPPWLSKRAARANDRSKQQTLTAHLVHRCSFSFLACWPLFFSLFFFEFVVVVLWVSLVSSVVDVLQMTWLLTHPSNDRTATSRT